MIDMTSDLFSVAARYVSQSSLEKEVVKLKTRADQDDPYAVLGIVQLGYRVVNLLETLQREKGDLVRFVATMCLDWPMCYSPSSQITRRRLKALQSLGVASRSPHSFDVSAANRQNTKTKQIALRLQNIADLLRWCALHDREISKPDLLVGESIQLKSQRDYLKRQMIAAVQDWGKQVGYLRPNFEPRQLSKFLAEAGDLPEPSDDSKEMWTDFCEMLFMYLTNENPSASAVLTGLVGTAAQGLTNASINSEIKKRIFPRLADQMRGVSPRETKITSDEKKPKKRRARRKVNSSARENSPIPSSQTP